MANTPSTNKKYPFLFGTCFFDILFVSLIPTKTSNMKKIMIIAAFLGLLATSAFCQTTSNAKPAAVKSGVKYVCPMCMAKSDKPGQCAHCKKALVKEGDYYCPGCGASSSKKGHCSACNKDMVR